jgi:hypothetical protein
MEQPINDLVGINNEDYWQRWPFLPVKRKSNKAAFGIETGVIHSFEKTRVVFANLFHLPETWEGFLELNRVSYNSVEELLEDGWEVD